MFCCLMGLTRRVGGGVLLLFDGCGFGALVVAGWRCVGLWCMVRVHDYDVLRRRYDDDIRFSLQVRMQSETSIRLGHFFFCIQDRIAGCFFEAHVHASSHIPCKIFSAV